MESQTLIAIVGVSGALVGSVIGGLVSYISSRAMRRMDWQLSSADKELEKRESLYADLLTEANRLLILSVDEKTNQSTAFTQLVALEARIWFYSECVASAARKITERVLDSHALTPQNKGEAFPVLRDVYISCCKEDLKALRNNV